MNQDLTPLGCPYLIGEAICEAIKSAPTLSGCKLIGNPSKAQDIAAGIRLIVFVDSGDAPGVKDGNGNADYRSYSFQAGAIARTSDARKQAHTDYRALKRVIRESVLAVAQKGIRIQGQVKETTVSFQLENLDVGGGLVLGTFTVDYRDPTPWS